MTVTCYLSELFNSKTARGFTDRRSGEKGERDRLEVRINIRAASFWKAMTCEPFDIETVPRRFYKTFGENEYAGDEEIHSLPPVFTADWLFVNTDIRQMLSDHGMPSQSFVPIELFQKDETTHIQKEYFVTIPQQSIKTVDRERSTQIRQPQAHLQEFFLESGVTHPTSRRRAKIVSISDFRPSHPLWVDPEFPKLIFLSTSFVRTLEEAKIKEVFQLYPVTAE